MESNPVVGNRRLPGERQTVVVHMRILWNVAGLVSLLVGASIALVLYFYHNDYADLELQAVNIITSFFISVLLNKTYLTDIKIIVNFKKTYKT